MSDEEMVAHLAPLHARPRDAAGLDRDAAARLRAGAARPPHAPGRDQRARGHGGRRAPRARVLRRQRGLGALHPAGLHAVQAGRRGGPRQPRPQARRAGQARPGGVGRQRRGGLPAHDRGHQPGGRLRQREGGRPAPLRRPAPAGAPGRRRRARRAAARAPARRARRGLERDGQAAHGGHLAADRGVRLLGRGRAARDGRGAVPGPPRPHQARPPVDPLRPGHGRRRGAAGARRRARRRVPRRLPRLRRRATATRAPCPPTPTRASCSSSTSA